MKLYISADIEGCAGVVSFQHLSPEGFEYREAREWMTGEVLAAIEGARAGGAQQVVVSDSHGNGQNLILDRMPPDVEVVRSWPRPLQMSQGLESDAFSAVMLLGYHSGHTEPAGVLAHTLIGAFYEVRLNGQPANETRLNAAIAGHFGVPVVLVTGDAAYVESALRLLPDVEAVVTKWSSGDYSTRTLMPARARELIREAAQRAMRRAAKIKPYTISTPITLDLVFKQRLPAEVLSLLRDVERTSATAVRYVARDMIDLTHFLVVASSYKADLR